MPSNETRRALVTGATSGIGRAIATKLLGAGWDVALLGRRRSALEALAARTGLAQGAARILACDLADRRDTDRALSHLVLEWPVIHGVVLNAGINDLTPLDSPDTAAFDRILETNLVSSFRILHVLVPRIPDGGRIVAIGSVLARVGIPNGHGYCAAKAGLSGLVRALALDLAPRGITVNTVLPGWVETPMADASIARQAPLLGLTEDEARKKFTGAVPIGRFLEPREVARFVHFLLGREAGGITGQSLSICGGVLA
jgi:NAD(P)-dependent dehydrogenase (short-subunit alcohol dehydrogenase family)